jgi:hypothetical protein
LRDREAVPRHGELFEISICEPAAPRRPVDTRKRAKDGAA